MKLVRLILLLLFAVSGFVHAEGAKEEWKAENPQDHGIPGADIILIRNPDMVMVGAMASHSRQDLSKKIAGFEVKCGTIEFFMNDDIVPPEKEEEKKNSLSMGFELVVKPEVWTYGPYAVVTFRPNGKCTCTKIKFVQFERIKGVLTYKNGDKNPQDKGWRIDAPRDKDGKVTDPANPGQISDGAFKPKKVEDAMEDNPGVINPWAQKDKDNNVVFPPGSTLHVEHDFITWIVCLPDGGGAELLGEVKWGYTQDMSIGAGHDDTVQTVHPKQASASAYDPNSDDAKQYKDLMKDFPAFLPQ